MNPRPANKVFERRKELRRPAQGDVRIEWGTPAVILDGRLKDMSLGGFRMVHQSQDLAAGQLVTFIHFAGQGKARVVWTRIVGATVESGFLVVQSGG
jgi:hypothetical protein